MATEEAAQESVDNVFEQYQSNIDKEQLIREQIRECVKELDKSTKKVQSMLQDIHFLKNKHDLSAVCLKARSLLDSKVKDQYLILETKVPPGEYYHYHEIWRHTLQRVSGSCALIHYLETEELVDRGIVAAMIGLKTVQKEANIYLDMEEFLHGLLQMASELSRFTVNCVTNGDYSRPTRIGKFMAELNNGFRELNLKNDHLRKRYDALKYDIKKIEEVIYDVSIRGLAANNSSDPRSDEANANNVTETN